MIQETEEEVLCVRVPLRETERVRRKLAAEGLLLPGRILREGGHALIPVRERVEGYPTVKARVKLRRRLTLKEVLRGRLTDEELEQVKRSFDIVGDIAVVQIPPELEHRRHEIGRALLEVQPGIRVVLRKLGGVEGELRLRKLEHLAGERRTWTVHREHGVELWVDLAKVYFSPRLAYERHRVMQQVAHGEEVVDMFAGAGGFALLIAKYRRARVLAIDLNESAVECMRRSISMNRLMGEVVPVHGDAREVTPEGVADRVIMNLPMGSDAFLETAFRAVRSRGVVHYYTAAPEGGAGEKMRVVEEAAESAGVEVEPLGVRRVRTYSPGTAHYVMDLLVRA